MISAATEDAELHAITIALVLFLLRKEIMFFEKSIIASADFSP